MPFGVVVVEVPQLVGHMVVSEIIVVEVLVALVVTHVVFVVTIVFSIQFIVPTVVDSNYFLSFSYYFRKDCCYCWNCC